jgi:hypothetical protein
MTWVEAARGPFERLLEAEEAAGREAVRARLEGLRLAYLDLRAGGTDGPLAEGVDTARTKGPGVLWMLRRALSPPEFEPVRESWERGGALDTASLREMTERLSRTDWGPFFDCWVYGSVLPEYRLRQAEVKGKIGSYVVTVQVENVGTGACSVPVAVQTEEGARHEFPVLASPGERAELRFPVVTRPVAAAVDPETDVLMACGERPWVPVRARRFWIF